MLAGDVDHGAGDRLIGVVERGGAARQATEFGRAGLEDNERLARQACAAGGSDEARRLSQPFDHQRNDVDGGIVDEVLDDLLHADVHGVADVCVEADVGADVLGVEQ